MILAEDDAQDYSELPIYHVHGFLPRTGELTSLQRASLVLSEDSYHHQFNDPYAWQTITQLSFLRDRVCLFIGFSMSDPDQRRLLEISQTKRPGARHYAVLKDHWSEAAHSDGSKEIAAYASIFRGLESASLLKLGVHPMWVREFSEIPAIIRSIREF